MEKTVTTPCNFSTLVSYTPTSQNPWNTLKVNHAYRRMAFGAPKADIDAALSLSPNDFIDSLVDAAHNLPPTPAPVWGHYTYNDFGDFDTENEIYLKEWAVQTETDLLNEKMRGRLAFFWMNHFVTELEMYYYAPYMYQYYHLMQLNALGNFREFVRGVGIDNAMLVYLNGFENTNTQPNENYARELFELFTLGEGIGYTQEDITNAARALTGYNHWDEIGGAIYFNASTFDDGEKTIFGQTGNWGYDDLINILFAERATEIATYICTKFYTFFVSPTIDSFSEQEIIQPLAQTMIDNDFEMVPVFKQLFKSEHFFDEEALGVIIKSPYDTILGYMNETGFHYEAQTLEVIYYFCNIVGQQLYDPPDVSGWQRDEDWINSSTLTGRWELMRYYNWVGYNHRELDITDFAKLLTNNSNDPAFIAKTLVDHFMAKELFTPTDYDIATDVLKWEVPQNYYDDGSWNLDWSSATYQVILLLHHIIQMPEFQLK
ncbi:DUF1800 domain-containing protein [Marixanthomonas spongiae]|uniref:DUF1800 domain-containing protein n=1 Tax=Marixanthomonas spongiae TaxID=2174845 RepID=A0A2U0I2V0_9FLAO|nr:DUF1800 domain-containing protein [Marixanthomonas spongiae]PVW15320.1 DUF1800 domain-containing protein [Marixanthomonas spongiae]